jgi:hypothetical protein
MIALRTTRSAGTNAYVWVSCVSNYPSSPDTEFRVRDDGQVASDGGTAMSSPADYADMMEWADGNPDNEDRVGYSVVYLPGSKLVRKATVDDDPRSIIGIVSGNPSVVGGAAWNRWIDKYLRDAFNRPIYEEYEAVTWTTGRGRRKRFHSYATDAVPGGMVVPADAERTLSTRRVLNPLFDGSAPYEPRADRREWDPVGLVGQIPAHPGIPVHPEWIKIGELDGGKSEIWHVR